MAEQQIVGFPVRPAPNSRTTKDSETFDLLAVNATFDGSGASDDFLPAVEVVSDAGRVVGRFPAEQVVAAGDSAEVTFAPFLRTLRGFIRYVFRNTGEWLSIHTTGNGSPLGRGIELVAEGAHGITIASDGGPVVLEGDQVQILDSAGGGTTITPDGSLTLESFSHDVDISAPNGQVSIDTPILSLLSLPIVNPGGSGQVWNDGGTLKVT